MTCRRTGSRGRPPAGDAETGNVYTFGVGGVLNAHDKNGKVIWTRSLTEEAGLVTTHGGRTVSPIVEGDLVIVSGITTGWGELARAGHRFMAFDKRTGVPVWISSPGACRPFDTDVFPADCCDVEGTPVLMAGGGDGTVHAIRSGPGEPVGSTSSVNTWREHGRRAKSDTTAIVTTAKRISIPARSGSSPRSMPGPKAI